MNNGYSSVNDPAEMQNGRKKVFVRHDVDVSLKMASQLARLESTIGLETVFFVMINSPFYNIHESEQKAMLQELKDGGFQIGLHANVQKNVEISEIEALVQVQRNILEISLGSPISLVSFHQPSSREMKFVFKDKSLFNVYQLSEMGVIYLSDSNMQFDIRLLQESVKQSKNMQLLIHPVWWYSEVENPGEVWEKMIFEKANEIRETIRATERSYEGNN